MREGPDFVCIGAPKAGTGWLYDQLAWHPGTWMPPIKELRYLARPKPQRTGQARRLLEKADADINGLNRSRRRDKLPPLGRHELAFLARYAVANDGSDLDTYAALFAAKGRLISGDITPYYGTMSPLLIAHLYRRFPRLKIIYLIREPVARTWSHLQMQARRATDRGGAFDIADARAVGDYLTRTGLHMHSRPTEIMDHWLAVFPREQVFHAFFDDISADAAAVRARIMEFLELDPAAGNEVIPPDFNRKRKRPKAPIPPAVRQYLHDVYSDEIVRCANVLGGPAARWHARAAQQPPSTA